MRPYLNTKTADAGLPYSGEDLRVVWLLSAHIAYEGIIIMTYKPCLYRLAALGTAKNPIMLLANQIDISFLFKQLLSTVN